eukprot:9791259-Prorocentrum_lima.AAC.1
MPDPLPPDGGPKALLLRAEVRETARPRAGGGRRAAQWRHSERVAQLSMPQLRQTHPGAEE